MPKRIQAADLFCGAGGTSTGLALACKAAGVGVDLLAINHWNVAIETHRASHPWARHLCTGLDTINPRDVIPKGRLNLLVASPECTNHSIARGGRPINDQSRATAWHILKWAQELYIDNILIENVREFRDWGPIGANGQQLKSCKGHTYQAFIEALKSLGYRVEDRVLNAADYGAPTSRQRLFIIARRGNKKINWPEPSHSSRGDATLFGGRKPYRTAREIIDWTLGSQSIFSRKKPLASATMDRIMAGLLKFNPELEPFIVTLRRNANARSIDEPIPTLTAGGTHIGLCEPFVFANTTGNGQHGVNEPIPTVTTRGNVALVEPFIIGHPRQRDGINCTPLDSLDKPLRTVTATSCDFSLVQPCLIKYYGNESGAESVNQPLDTVTTKDRFGLAEGSIDQLRLDIRFRMLQPHELARAQGFPDDYEFRGNKSEIVKQIGNAVPVPLAQALCASLLVA